MKIRSPEPEIRTREHARPRVLPTGALAGRREMNLFADAYAAYATVIFREGGENSTRWRVRSPGFTSVFPV